MVKAEWGTKRYCQKCQCKYYDMSKDPITCPTCGTEYTPEFLRSRDDLRAKSAKKEDVIEVIEVEGTDDGLLEADEDDAEEVIIDKEIEKEDEEN